MPKHLSAQPSRAVLFAILSLILVAPAKAQFAAGQFNYEGRLLDENGAAIPGPIDLRLEIRDQNNTCSLYVETHSGVTLTDGFFSLRIGSGTAVYAPLSFTDVFKNGWSPSFTSSGTYCGSGNPTIGANDHRLLRVTIDDDGFGSGNAEETLTPDQVISAIPVALRAAEADKLQGTPASGFIKSQNQVTQANLTTLTDGSDAGALHNHDGVYAKINSSSSMSFGAQETLGLGTFTTAQESTMSLGPGDAGKTWYNSTTNTIMYWDGDSAEAVGSGSGGVGGISSLNGDSSATQTLALGTTGTAPAWSTSAGIHTLNLPLASNAGVTAGLISKAQFDSFSGKLDGTAAAGGDLTGNYPNPSIANDTITGAMILDGQVDAVDLADNSVTLAKLADGTTAEHGKSVLWNNTSGNWEYYTPPNTSLNFVNGGNSFGAAAVLGTNDNFPLKFRANGTDAMIIHPDGNVGIGTNAPFKPLHVYKPTGTGALFLESGNGEARIDFRGKAGFNVASILQNNSSNALRFQNTNIDKMLITSTGVGIGTLTPLRSLDVNGNDGMRLRPSTQPVSPGAGDMVIDSGDTNKLKYYNGSAWTTVAAESDSRFPSTVCSAGSFMRWDGSTWQCENDSGGTVLGTGTAGRIVKYGTGGTNVTDSIIFENTGKIGIGTTSPGATLDVQGDLRVQQICDEFGTNCKDISTGWGTGGAASGDLSGTYPGPTVAGIRGKSISITAPATTGQMLRWNNSTTQWEPSTDGSALTSLNASNLSSGAIPIARMPALTGDVIAGIGSTSTTIANSAVTSAKIADGTITSADIADGTITSGDLATSLTNGLWAESLGNVSRSTGNVGIGLTNPTAKLEVAGQIKITGGLPGSGKVLMSDATGLANWQSLPGGGDMLAANNLADVPNTAAARTNLGLAIGTHVQAYDADLDDLADGSLTATKVQNGSFFIDSAGTSGQVWTSDGIGAGAWTTPTNTNTASTIVKRDASGNFSAGTITANLTGNVTGNATNVTGTVAVANGGTGTTNGSITGTGALAFTAGGTNQNITLTPSGTGNTLLNGTGNVGIGTSAPAAKLDVNGTIKGSSVQAGSATLSSTLSVGGNATVTGSATVTGDLTVAGYTQVAKVASGSPPTTDCDDPSEVGRMKVGGDGKRMWVCSWDSAAPNAKWEKYNPFPTIRVVTAQNNPAVSQVAQVSCAANEVVIGGGCNANFYPSTFDAFAASRPLGSPPTTWECVVYSPNMRIEAYAICADFNP